MKFLKWLENGDDKSVTDIEKSTKIEDKKEVTVLEQTMVDIEKNEAVIIELKKSDNNKFIDPETGKTYKTEKGLKIATTRRKNKLKRKNL